MVRIHKRTYYLGTSWPNSISPALEPARGRLGGRVGPRAGGSIPAGSLDHSAFTVAAADFLFGQSQGWHQETSLVPTHTDMYSVHSTILHSTATLRVVNTSTCPPVEV